ncbi:MAG: mannitol dehydrogenase [Nitrospiraceae bacterium]|nr:mannitol dehydrogenase [Nitrospiraceae bacterium]
MKSVQFGAGSIGRGFIAQLFFESGYQTTFVDVLPGVVKAIQSRRSYPIRIVGEISETRIIEQVDAIFASDTEAVADAVASADLAATAVGVNVLPHIAPLLALGIERRFVDPDAAPLNVIICENMLNAGPFLREKVREHLPERFHRALDAYVGFVEASIGRMVPAMPDSGDDQDPLLICVEAYCDLPVDSSGFRGPIPTLAHMKTRDNFAGYVERKLFIHNAGHATVAYLGYLRGHEFVWQAVEDEKVRATADAAMAESIAALVKKHGFTEAELAEHWQDLLRRFSNKQLGDQVARVAKDPLRKLGPNDRLIGAARACLDQGVEPLYLAFAAAAAIRYDLADDPAARELQKIRHRHGLRGVLKQVCHIPDDSHLADLIVQGEQRLRNEGWTE